jgi:hypothetical protein
MKLPILYAYRQTEDDGAELRYSLRSLNNITNWNGEVYIVGDVPSWIQGVHHKRPFKRSHDPYVDVAGKLYDVFADSELPDTFIYLNDDVYVTKKMTIKTYAEGEINPTENGYHKNSLRMTKTWLQENGYPVLNYDIHTPMIIERDKWLPIYQLFKDTGSKLQWRSLYGNIYGIKSEHYEDKKTYTAELPDAPIISTNYYTDELKELFTQKTRFEQ